MDWLAERFSTIIDRINPNEITTLFEIGSRDAKESCNLARVFEDAHIHTFEPVPYNINMCKEVIRWHPFHIQLRVHLHEVAANNVTGPMDFYALDLNQQSGNNHGIASKFQLIDPDMFPNEHSVQTKITVDGWRIDDWCTANNVDRIDGIWMDAQGAELDILQGMGDMLEHTQFIMTEAGIKPYYHGHTLKVDMDAYMASKGFVEWHPATKLSHEYEVDMIYVNPKLVNVD